MEVTDRIFIGLFFTLLGLVPLVFNEHFVRLSLGLANKRLPSPGYGEAEITAGRILGYSLGVVFLAVGVSILLGILPGGLSVKK